MTNIRFVDFNDCSIEFESTNIAEKQLLRDIYLKLIGLTETERNVYLSKILEDYMND